MPKDAAFWQFLYLIFAKMHDENLRAEQRQAWQRRFWAGPKEQFEVQGRKAIRVRIEELFAEVKKKYRIFSGGTRRSPSPTGRWPLSFLNWPSTISPARMSMPRAWPTRNWWVSTCAATVVNISLPGAS